MQDWRRKRNDTKKNTVFETSTGLRKGGAAIDVRGEALNIAERMGIVGKIKLQK